MNDTTFRWYLKKQLMQATPNGTLNLRTLADLAKDNAHLKALLLLYITDRLDTDTAQRRVPDADLLAGYGDYYFETGYPPLREILNMPQPYRAIYDDYRKYLSGKHTRLRMKIKCKEEMLVLMGKQGLSIRSVGKRCNVDFACISRFLHGNFYALSEKRLSDILTELKRTENQNMDSIFVIDDFKENTLAEGMIEVSFTISADKLSLTALRQFCIENKTSTNDLIELFLKWIISNPDEASLWLDGQRKKVIS